MTDIRDSLRTTLNQATFRLRETDLPGALASEMERLAKEVSEPCVVAVVGEVKVGKSTFVNAFLGEDLAKVGTHETTATINYFSYGNPDENKPVRVYWRSGAPPAHESRTFLDGLQGNDEETLKEAEGVDHLEYFLPNSCLKQITLVDTPGTGAVVKEHQERAEEFLLRKRLRERHHQETQKIRNRADAVIYLVGPVAKADDKEFLEGFQRATGGQASALNAMGVLSKIELYPDAVRRREELAELTASQLKDKLNTVIPVGAGVQRALDRLLKDDQAVLKRLVETLRRIPPENLPKLLKTSRKFKEKEYGDRPGYCPVSAAERQELAGEMPWGVFTTIAPVAADRELDYVQVAERLKEISGFERLREVVDERFISRSHILRCYRIISDASELTSKLEYRYVREYRKQAAEDRARMKRLVAFIRQAGGDPSAAKELEALVHRHLDPGRKVEELEELYEDLSVQFDALRSLLEELNKDFDALQQLQKRPEEFSPEERDELSRLLGLYGTEIEDRLREDEKDIKSVQSRQIYWRIRIDRTRVGSARRAVVDRAVSRYGLILGELKRRGSTRTNGGAEVRRRSPRR